MEESEAIIFAFHFFVSTGRNRPSCLPLHLNLLLIDLVYAILFESGLVRVSNKVM